VYNRWAVCTQDRLIEGNIMECEDQCGVLESDMHRRKSGEAHCANRGVGSAFPLFFISSTRVNVLSRSLKADFNDLRYNRQKCVKHHTSNKRFSDIEGMS
jgi:hypothetical protein